MRTLRNDLMFVFTIWHSFHYEVPFFPCLVYKVFRAHHISSSRLPIDLGLLLLFNLCAREPRIVQRSTAPEKHVIQLYKFQHRNQFSRTLTPINGTELSIQ